MAKPKGWRVVRWGNPDTGQTQVVTVTPRNDTRRHASALKAPDCWCKPYVERQPNGAQLVVHNAADGRELVEQHGVN